MPGFDPGIRGAPPDSWAKRRQDARGGPFLTLPAVRASIPTGRSPHF